MSSLLKFVRDVRDLSIGRVAFAKGDPLVIARGHDGGYELMGPCSFLTRMTPAFTLSHLSARRMDHARRTKKRRRSGRARLFATSVIEPVSSDYRLNELREPGERKNERRRNEADARHSIIFDYKSKFFFRFSIFQIYLMYISVSDIYLL